MTDLSALKAANAARWQRARTTRAFAPVAKYLVAADARARYQAVEAKTGVPWFFIAVVHQREAGQRWDRQLGQGDPLYEVSRHDPKGRGPFKTWEDGAVDALEHCPPFAARNKDWSIGGLLTMLEQYNGLGYFFKGKTSPYLWSGTSEYISGKFVADHVYNPNVVDAQLGCAGLLLAMATLDKSINLGTRQLPPNVVLDGQIAAKPTAPAVSATPSITNPSKGSIGAWIASLLAAIFKRKT